VSSVSLDTLNSADRASFMAAIGEVMELATWVADEAYAKRPFASLAALYAFLGNLAGETKGMTDEPNDADCTSSQTH